MKFLEKIEDAINQGLEKLGHKIYESLKVVTPEIIPHYYQIIKNFFPAIIEKIKALGPKLKILFIKLVGYTQHYIHIIQGKVHATILYFRSKEFKEANKKDLILAPFIKLKGSFKVNPVKTSIGVTGFLIVLAGTKIITHELLIVKNGLKQLRAPASADIVIEEDNKLDIGSFKLKKISMNHGTSHESATDAHAAPKAEAHGPAPKAEAHAAPAPATPAPDAHGGSKPEEKPSSAVIEANNANILKGPELEAEKFEPEPFEDTEEIAIDIKIKFDSSKIKNKLEADHALIHDIKHLVEHTGVPSDVTLPLDQNERKAIALNFETHMKTDPKFKALFATNFIWEINQEEVKKPRYHLAYLRQFRFSDIGLQLLLEETKRNRQVYFEFTVQTVNREGIVFLKHHEVEIKDHLMMNVEPVVPGLPLDEEGKRIIRDKVKFEINNYIKLNHLETEVEEVFIDYMLAS